MIIPIIYNLGVGTIKAKSQAPISAHPNRPVPPHIASKSM